MNEGRKVGGCARRVRHEGFTETKKIGLLLSGQSGQPQTSSTAGRVQGRVVANGPDGDFFYGWNEVSLVPSRTA